MTDVAATKTLGDYLSLVRRRWRYLVLIIPAVLMVALFIAYVLPAQYLASSVIMLEASSLPTEMVPTTVTGTSEETLAADKQMELTRRKVMSKENLIALVKEVDPYPQLNASPEDKASILSGWTSLQPVDPITLEPMRFSPAFSIDFINPDPQLAKEVAAKLGELFLTYNQKVRAEKASEAYTFLQTQATELETSMRQMETKLAQFKAKYGDALPEAQGRNIMGIDRTQRLLDDLERDIREAEQAESLLKLQLSETSPSLTAAVSDWRTELAKLRAELALAEQKYTPEHPDVKRLKRAITDLAALGGAGEKIDATPDNPEYLRIKSELGAKQRELSALRANAARTRGQLFGYESAIATAPNVEREYLQLAREHDNARARYEDLQAKIKQAALAQTLETEAKGERFSLIRAPYTPREPHSPNRLGIILLGFVLGAGLAIVAAVIADASDPSVRGSLDLQEIMSTTPMGAVPVIFNRQDVQQRRKLWGAVAAVYGIAAVVVTITVLAAE